MATSSTSRRPRPASSTRVLGLALIVGMVLPMALLGIGSVAAATPHALTYGHTSPGKGGGGSCTGGTVTPTSSSNWGGYAAETCLNSPSSGVVSDVKGTWVQPTVTCAAGETSYAAFWVGIDGYSSRSVEQTGTDSDCQNGVPTYYAWYEMYPKAPVNLALAIHPNDVVTAEVAFTGSGHFVLTIKDGSTGVTSTTTQTYTKAARSSAEWIAEAPSGGGVLPLANFHVVNFTACSATIRGVNSGTITNNAWQVADITMSGTSGVKAATSPLTGGSAFSSTWEHS